MNSLEKLIEDLNHAGFAIGKFQWDIRSDPPYDLDYTLRVGHVTLEDLGLSNYLEIGVTMELPTEIADLDAFVSIKPVIKSRYVFFKSFKHDDNDFESPGENEYGDLALRLKEEHTFMQKLKGHLELKKYLDSDDLRSERFDLPSPVLGLSFGKLYGQLVRQGGLKWFNLMEQNFPYVVTDSNTLPQIGLGIGRLYFVATDVANEPWKEAIVAIHESYCGRSGHAFAMEQETKLAKFLGKEVEHKLFREQIKSNHYLL